MPSRGRRSEVKSRGRFKENLPLWLARDLARPKKKVPKAQCLDSCGEGIKIETPHAMIFLSLIHKNHNQHERSREKVQSWWDC